MDRSTRMTWLDTEDTTWLSRARSWPLAAEPLRASQRDLAACRQLPEPQAAISAAYGETQR